MFETTYPLYAISFGLGRSIKHRHGESLLPPEDRQRTLKAMSFLSPSDPGIVPMSEAKLTASCSTPQPGSPQANTRKVYLKDFPQYVHDMLTDTGYKFSEEYEVSNI